MGTKRLELQTVMGGRGRFAGDSDFCGLNGECYFIAHGHRVLAGVEILEQLAFLVDGDSNANVNGENHKDDKPRFSLIRRRCIRGHIALTRLAHKQLQFA